VPQTLPSRTCSGIMECRGSKGKQNACSRSVARSTSYLNRQSRQPGNCEGSHTYRPRRSLIRSACRAFQRGQKDRLQQRHRPQKQSSGRKQRRRWPLFHPGREGAKIRCLRHRLERYRNEFEKNAGSIAAANSESAPRHSFQREEGVAAGGIGRVCAS